MYTINLVKNETHIPSFIKPRHCTACETVIPYTKWDHNKSYQRKKYCSSSCACGKQRRTHGMSRTPLHLLWKEMHARCTNKNRPHYDCYGGRGIYVCERWEYFENFYKDMAGTYQKGLTLERRNNDGPYHPDNCLWATRKQQAANRRTNRVITFQGETHPAIEWARLLNIPYATFESRLRNQWNIERIVHTPISPARRGKKGQLSAQEKATIVTLARSVPQSEIARQLKIGKTTVSRFLQSYRTLNTESPETLMALDTLQLAAALQRVAP